VPLRLVTLDLDGTLLPHDTVFAAVLRESGKAREVEASDARYEAGAITLEECFWEQWPLIQALSPADLHRALRKAAWLPGIADGVRRLKEAGVRTCLLTDQPSTLTDFLGRWGLTDAICSPVKVKDGRQVGIDARFDKLANLRGRLVDWRIDARDVGHVGNGANDVPVFEAVGRSVACFAPPEVARHAHAVIPEPRDLLQAVESILA
jgi:phosphoserine phosphatase